MTEALRAIVFAGAALGGTFAWISIRTTRMMPGTPEQLVAQFRLAQFGALLLALTAGTYIGFAAAHEQRPGIGLDVALTVGFFVAATTALAQDPREALTILAGAFVAHALIDIMHRPGLLPAGIAPR
ncbi:MAG: hypothetical protein LC804_26820, partial [Acidobacteria bacterium]|nr:hypothetical protein [Acidobacteriota bacterium]